MPFWLKTSVLPGFSNLVWAFVWLALCGSSARGAIADESFSLAIERPAQIMPLLQAIARSEVGFPILLSVESKQAPLSEQNETESAVEMSRSNHVKQHPHLMTLLLVFLLIAIGLLSLGVWLKSRRSLQELRRQLRLKNTELEILEKRKHHLIATVSHDLKNPLTGILGIIDTLRIKETFEDHKMREELIDLASSSVLQATSIVENLINLESIYSGQLQLQLELRVLQPILKVVVIENKLMLQAKGQRLVSNFELSTRNVSILCDESALIQVFSTLIGNASKYSPADSKIELSMKVTGDEVVVGVRDEGPGISSDQFELLFNPFSNPDGMKKSMGFGLSIVKSLVEAMEGEVGVESIEGKGSHFWVRFALQTESEVPDKVVLVKPVGI